MNKDEMYTAILANVRAAVASSGHTYKELWRILYKAFEILHNIPIHKLYKEHKYPSKIAYLMDHEEDLKKLYELSIKLLIK
jgi:hypothetical protein